MCSSFAVVVVLVSLVAFIAFVVLVVPCVHAALVVCAAGAVFHVVVAALVNTCNQTE